jgi:hypothetical protein
MMNITYCREIQPTARRNRHVIKISNIPCVFQDMIHRMGLLLSSPEGELLQSRTAVVWCMLAAHVSQPLSRFLPDSSMLYVKAISPDLFFIFAI